MERCCREIAAIKAQIRAGHPDLQGLCLGLADWSAELRLLQVSQGLAPAAPRLAHVRSCGDGLGYRPQLGEDGQESRSDAEKPAAAGAGRARGEAVDATR